MKERPRVATALPKVAIVGRPNVGKSSLFNRIVRARRAIVYKEIGTTRDRVIQEASFKSTKFMLIDTGGFVPEDKTLLLKSVKEQIKKAINESDVLLFVCDGQAGLTPQDSELASTLRSADKKIFLVINKADNPKMEEEVLDFYQLSLDRPYPVSALHNIGIEELLGDLVKEFPTAAHEKDKQEPVRVAILGRPNVGKSSFLNCLLKEERAIVDEVPGTTRDAIDTYLKYGETEFMLIDTAGMRHKRKIKEAVDVYSIMRTKEAVKRSQICTVLVDAYDGLVTDDLKILELVINEGKSCILCVNKWDLIKNLSEGKYKEMIYRRVAFLKKYPVLFTSAKTGYNVYNSLRVIKQVINDSQTKVHTPQLNKLLVSFKAHPPFSSRKNGPRINYATQTRTSPPVFLLFVNEPRFIKEEHLNFLENSIRKNFGFFGSPIMFEFRKRGG